MMYLMKIKKEREYNEIYQQIDDVYVDRLIQKDEDKRSQVIG